MLKQSAELFGQLVETGEPAATIRSIVPWMVSKPGPEPTVLFGQSASGDAEGMPLWIGENPCLVPVRLVIRLARTELQQPVLGFGQVVLDLEADVKLLGNGLVGPARSPVAVDPLKTDEEPVLAVEAREVGVRFRVRFKAGGLLIERSQSERIGAIERYRNQLHLHRHGISGPVDGLHR